MEGLSSLFSLQGRTGRAGYWLVAVYQVGGLVLLAVVSGFVTGLDPAGARDGNTTLLAVWCLGGLILAWIGFAGTVRRWHDRDKSAWWIFIAAVPLIGPIWTLVELGFLAGTPAANRFGPPPGGGLGAWAEEAPAAGGDLDAIVARWATSSTPAPATVSAGRFATSQAERPPVIVRPGAGGFGRRGLR